MKKESDTKKDINFNYKKIQHELEKVVEDFLFAELIYFNIQDFSIKHKEKSQLGLKLKDKAEIFDRIFFKFSKGLRVGKANATEIKNLKNKYYSEFNNSESLETVYIRDPIFYKKGTVNNIELYEHSFNVLDNFEIQSDLLLKNYNLLKKEIEEYK